MDTITQITLGAAVGEAVLGKKVGNKAPLAGAVVGVLPDLDVLANPFLNQVQEIAVHRGITHSIFFCLVVPPLLGWVLNRIMKKSEAGWKDWSLMVFWVLITHIFLDLCTSYGTQIFQPFSSYPASLNSIFIIDPFYTLPLLGGLAVALFYKPGSRTRIRMNAIGLAISTLYLLSGLFLKLHVNHVFEENYRNQQIGIERYMTTPAPLSIFLWTGYAESSDTVYAGLYSVFDDDREIKLHPIPQRSELIQPYIDQVAMERLIWFSNGYYAVSRGSETLLFHDLRFGRSDLWLTERNTPFVWNYRLLFNDDSTQVIGVDRFEPTFDIRSGRFRQLYHRTFGRK
ncbi:MAG: metal-dependent hydrolase, partial [Balneolaceae bacterium]|nr:metal-dependent hydrolase [Balneolaceae bacterium]